MNQVSLGNTGLITLFGVALLNQYQANNNQKSTHTKATGYPRVWFVVFMVASTWGVPFRSEMELGTLLSPLFGESLRGENSCLLDRSLWGVPIPIPHHSFRDQMYKSNPAAESHVWGLPVSAWAIVFSKLSSFTFSSQEKYSFCRWRREFSWEVTHWRKKDVLF